jgi:hypothetical protein
MVYTVLSFRYNKRKGQTMTTLTDLKKQLRALKKLKKDAPVGSESRRQINKSIRALKKERQSIEVSLAPTEEKQVLIDELTKLYEFRNRPFLVDFRIYTVEQLKIHINKLKGNLV